MRLKRHCQLEAIHLKTKKESGKVVIDDNARSQKIYRKDNLINHRDKVHFENE